MQHYLTLLTFIFINLFNFAIVVAEETVSHCGFNLPYLDDKWCQLSYWLICIFLKNVFLSTSLEYLLWPNWQLKAYCLIFKYLEIKHTHIYLLLLLIINLLCHQRTYTTWFHPVKFIETQFMACLWSNKVTVACSL